jgi:hypothetical protein
MGLVDDYAKIPFLNSCVYYSKGWDKFTAILGVKYTVCSIDSTQ